MTFEPHGKNLIAGDWVSSDATFTADPIIGPSVSYFDGNADIVEAACAAAEAAFWTYGSSSEESRAAFLTAIADEIEKRAEAITYIGSAETGLPEVRLQGERARTTGQLRLFAEHILSDSYPETRHDPALQDRSPMPRPELTMVHRPIGPVAIFGASNFPLAFSTAGGDTAAALAAGCPVVFKAHPAHPGTCEIVADAIQAAIEATGQPAGTFSMVHGTKPELGAALVQHPMIKAVAFTGSLHVGRILFDLCAARPTPIPFFGELGAINPVFILPAALAARGDEIAAGWANSVTMGVGQFCTKPGIVFVPKGNDGDAFVAKAKAALEEVPGQIMLSKAIAQSYQANASALEKINGLKKTVSSRTEGRKGTASLYEATAELWNNTPELNEEIFGPHGLIVRTEDESDMLRVAHELQGQLTATIHMECDDSVLVRKLLPILEQKAGRILANGFPTGVEVSESMVHGGPYPASTNFGATSVGILAIRRFLRPVCYQNFSDVSLFGAK